MIPSAIQGVDWVYGPDHRCTNCHADAGIERSGLWFCGPCDLETVAVCSCGQHWDRETLEAEANDERDGFPRYAGDQDDGHGGAFRIYNCGQCGSTFSELDQ